MNNVVCKSADGFARSAKYLVFATTKGYISLTIILTIIIFFLQLYDKVQLMQARE